MLDSIARFLSTSPYAPHGYCLLWQPELIWTHVVADTLIALAYFSIPGALVYFVMKRRDLSFRGVFWLFALFITACGATHVMAIWTLWRADYGVEALVKIVTALASIATAGALWPLMPRLLAIPSPAALRAANAELSHQVEQREAALTALRAEVVERQRAEEALTQAQKLQALGQLTGGIAHDFNNLLQAVLGSVELIAARAGDSQRVGLLAQRARQSIDHGRRLTAKLLAFSRVQALSLQPVALAPLFEAMHELLARTLGPSVEISIDVGLDDPWVMADATQLELALLNLAINARDAMPEGGALRILARAAQDEVGGDMVEILVSDNGAGMSSEIAERAFEPFFTTKGVGEGAGLGLSMVYGMARQSGGSVKLASIEGGGTTVTIALRRAAPAVTIDGAPAPLDVDSMIGRLAVLVVDDDPRVRSALSDGLTVLGHQVIEAGDGPAALAALRGRRPDLMVLDYAMPGMSGAEVARLARLSYPGLPILFASGHADRAALSAAVGETTLVLRKPFTLADLTTAMSETLRRAA